MISPRLCASAVGFPSYTSEPIDRGAALLGFAVIVLANFRYLAGLSRILDPVMSMEPFYINLAERGVGDILSLDPAWGTLYALWLKPLRAQLVDPLLVFTANVYLLSFGLSLSIYVYTLLLTRRAAVATGAALFLLVSDLNVPLSSKVCAFALMVVLVGLVLSELAARHDRRMAIAACGVLLASYARPELYPSGLCLWMAALWFARRDALEGRLPTLGWVVGGTTLILGIAWWVGTPVWSAHHDDGRLLDAFREHFAWNWLQWSDTPEFYLDIWQREFGAADSIMDAFLHNPTAVARHLAVNLIGVVPALFSSVFDHYPVLVPPTSPGMVRAETMVMAAVILTCIAWAAASRERRRRMWERYRHVCAIFLALSIFPIGGAVLIYPSLHYLIIPAVCLLLASILAVSFVLPGTYASYPARRMLSALIVLAMVPTPFVLPTEYFLPGQASVGRFDVRRDVTDAVERIRSLEIPKPVHVLTFTDGLGELAGAGFHEVKVWQRGQRPLKEYLEGEHIDVIVTMEPGRHSFRVDDPYWQTIQLEPEKTGFVPVTAPDAVARIWVRADLLEK